MIERLYEALMSGTWEDRYQKVTKIDSPSLQIELAWSEIALSIRHV